ncbi:hypothetical protein E8211_004979 [Escherichia coli]|nr:hypothetical protein [Escherichia coli]
MRVKRTARANVSREIFEAEQRRDGFDKIHAGTKGKARAIRARNSGKKGYRQESVSVLGV